MNILHVLSQFEVTGAEAYTATLVAEQAQCGHRLFVASDTISLELKAHYVQQPIGKRSYPQRIKNILWLVRFIKDHQIHIVHAHSRAASWVCHLATWITGTPFISTVHGRQHVHISSKAFSIYGKNIIAVCESVKEHLVRDLGLHSSSIVVIPNGIELLRWEGDALGPSRQELLGFFDDKKMLMFVGRLTGPKGDIVRFLLKEVLPLVLNKTRVALWVIGGMITPEDIPLLAKSINNKHNEPIVNLKGFQKDLAHYITHADVVIASGRVVPESLAMKKNVVAFGESNYVGLVTPESFNTAAATNFGDTGIFTQVDPQRVADDLIALFKKPPSQSNTENLLPLVRQRFDSKLVADKIQKVYEHARTKAFSPVSIPVLMYHRVLEKSPEQSTHGIWVTAEAFASQLQSLKKRGFNTITFNDYAAFIRGTKSLPKRPIILTFDDGYEDNYTAAFPLLQQYGFRAVIFAVTDQRRTNFWDPNEPPASLMKPSQLRELTEYGNEIGSHTVSHANLTAVTPEQCKRELADSRKSLEHMLGMKIISFAYPYGAFDQTAKKVAEETGYKFAVAADSGPFTFYDDFMEIRRTQVFPWTNSFGFWKKIQPWYYRYKSLMIHKG